MKVHQTHVKNYQKEIPHSRRLILVRKHHNKAYPILRHINEIITGNGSPYSQTDINEKAIASAQADKVKSHQEMRRKLSDQLKAVSRRYKVRSF